MTRRRKRNEWTRIVAKWRSSKLTAAEFARRHDLKPRQLLFWSWQLGRSAARDSTSPDPLALIELPPSAQLDDRLELVLTNGRVLRFGSSTDAGRLSAFIQAAETHR